MKRCLLSCVCALYALSIGVAAASQQNPMMAAVSLRDPASAQVPGELVVPNAVPRRLKDAGTRRRRLPLPPRLRPAEVQSASLIDIAPPLGAVLLESRESGEQLVLNAPAASVPTANEALAFPLLQSAPVIASFGLQPDPLTGQVRFHRGIDLAAPAGTPVRAAAAGLVLAAGAMGSLGNAVVLGHGPTGRSRYAHLQEVLVRPGELVEQGAIIGRVGASGRAGAPHLHFEYWQKTEIATWQARDAAGLFPP